MERDETVDIKTFLENWNLLQTSLALGTAWSQITEDTLKNSWKNLLKDHTAATTSTSETSIDLVLIDPPVDPEVLQTWVEEDLPTSVELTDAAIVDAILNPEPEFLEEIPEESEDEIQERRYTLPEQLEAFEILLRSMMEHDDFGSTDSLQIYTHHFVLVALF